MASTQRRIGVHQLVGSFPSVARVELHHWLSDVTHRHPSLDDQRIRGEIGDPF